MINKYKLLFYSFFLAFIFVAFSNEVIAQDAPPPIQGCIGAPSFDVDLTGQPDGGWTSPAVSRDGRCCDSNPNPPVNDKCVTFNLTLDQGTSGIVFEIASGAIPSGAMYYKLDCDTVKYQLGDVVCLSSTKRTYQLTFCKAGNNLNTYSIVAVPAPTVSTVTTLSNGCSEFIYSSGFDPYSIQWKAISTSSSPVLSSDSVDYYNGFLSGNGCMSADGCSSVEVNAGDVTPAWIDYQVSGYPVGDCRQIQYKLLSRVYFINDKKVIIEPKDTVICFGNTTTTITANGFGGSGDYTYLWSTGETTESITVEPGTYVVQMYDQYTQCAPVTDEITVLAHEAPISVNAGGDQVLCANSPAVSLKGSVEIAKGAVWSVVGSTSGTFSPNNTTLNATFTPTADQIAAGTVTLRLTTTGNDGCPGDTDDVVIIYKPAPTADAGPAQSHCASKSSVTLAGVISNATGGVWSGGTGSFFPNRNTLNATYTPTAAEKASGWLNLTLTTTGTAPCKPATSNMQLLFTPAPTVNAGPDQTVCTNDGGVKLAGQVGNVPKSYSWSGGQGVFSPSASALNAVYTPTAQEYAAGSITLTLTAYHDVCNSVSDAVLITFTAVPTVNAGPDQAVCTNNSVIKLNGSVTLGGVVKPGMWSTSGTGTFNTSTKLDATYTPSSGDITSGKVTLMLVSTENGNCKQESDQMILTIAPAPTVTTPKVLNFCSNKASVQLSGAITVATGGVWTTSGTGTFSPNTTTINASYIPHANDIANGSVTLTLTSTGNGNCVPVKSNTTIFIDPAPTVNAGRDQIICANNIRISLLGQVTNSEVGETPTYSWSGGTGIFSARSSLATSYSPTASEVAAGSVRLTLTASRSDCNAVSDNVLITFTPAPYVNAGTDKTVCGNNAIVTLNGSVTGGATGGIWSGGAGMYSSSTDLKAKYTPSATEIAAGKVTLTLTSTGIGNCNPVSDQMNITITPAPTVSAGLDEEICSDFEVINLKGNVTVAAGAVWTTTGTGTFSPNVTDLNARYYPSEEDMMQDVISFTLTSIGNNNCKEVSDGVSFAIRKKQTADAGTDQTVCTDTEGVLLAGIVTGANAQKWTTSGSGTFMPADNALNARYVPSQSDMVAGTVILTLTTSESGVCKNPATDQMILTIIPAPVADAGEDQTICRSVNSIALNGNVAVATGGIWTSNGTGTFSPDANTLDAVYSLSEDDKLQDSITFTLTTTGNGICTPITDKVTLVIIPIPVVNAGADQVICTNKDQVELKGSSQNVTSTVWSSLGGGAFYPDASALEASYNFTEQDRQNGEAVLILKSVQLNSCNEVTDTVKVKLDACTAIIPAIKVEELTVYPVPNNGIFRINMKEKGPSRLLLFDMAGKEVFRKDFNVASQETEEVVLPQSLKGMFLIKLTTEQSIYTRKLIVQ